MSGWQSGLMCCCACQELLGAALDLASAGSSNTDSIGGDADLGSCVLQGMVQTVGSGTAQSRQLTNARPFWQQRTFSTASSAIVQVIMAAAVDKHLFGVLL